MTNARFRAYLSKYKHKEALNQIWGRGCGGCNLLELFYLIKYVLKCHLIQEIIHFIMHIHFSVFIPIHHSFGFSDIFLEGISRP